jgi:hypothetical protein
MVRKWLNETKKKPQTICKLAVENEHSRTLSYQPIAEQSDTYKLYELEGTET